MLLLNFSSILVHPFFLMFSSSCSVQNTLLASPFTSPVTPSYSPFLGYLCLPNLSMLGSPWTLYLVIFPSLSPSISMQPHPIHGFKCHQYEEDFQIYFFSADLCPKLGPHVQLPSRYFYLDNHQASKTSHSQLLPLPPHQK